MSKFYGDLTLTLFPDNVDTFPQWLDIVASDGPLVKQYIDAMNKGNAVEASQILARIPSGKQKIINAVDLNKMTQAVLAVERFYKKDIRPYIENKQASWESIINQFDYKGTWSSGVNYAENNMVSYTLYGNKFIYIAINEVPTGIRPTDANYWRPITVQGKQGVSGKGLSYREEWKNSVEYNVNDAVTYSGSLWMAIATSQSQEPTTSSNVWKLIMSLPTTTYPIQDTQPTAQEVGELWFNTQGNPTKFYYLETLENPAKREEVAEGKQVYDAEGKLIVGTGSVGNIIEWNDESETSFLAWG